MIVISDAINGTILLLSKPILPIKNLKEIIDKRLEFYHSFYIFYHQEENLLFTLVSVEYFSTSLFFKNLTRKIKSRYPIPLNSSLVLLEISSFVEIIEEFS